MIPTANEREDIEPVSDLWGDIGMNENEQVTKIKTVRAGLTSSWKGNKKRHAMNRWAATNFFQCACLNHT